MSCSAGFDCLGELWKQSTYLQFRGCVLSVAAEGRECLVYRLGLVEQHLPSIYDTLHFLVGSIRRGEVRPDGEDQGG